MADLLPFASIFIGGGLTPRVLSSRHPVRWYDAMSLFVPTIEAIERVRRRSSATKSGHDSKETSAEHAANHTIHFLERVATVDSSVSEQVPFHRGRGRRLLIEISLGRCALTMNFYDTTTVVAVSENSLQLFALARSRLRIRAEEGRARRRERTLGPSLFQRPQRLRERRRR